MVNYYLDITESEYTDITYETTKMDHESGEAFKSNPTFVGFPYRSMS